MDYGFRRPQLAALTNTKESVSRTATAVCAGDCLQDEMKWGERKCQSDVNLITGIFGQQQPSVREHFKNMDLKRSCSGIFLT